MVIDITPAPILSKGWGTPTNAALETLAAQAQTADEVASIASAVAEAKFAEVSVDLVDATMTATAETPSSDFAQHLNGTFVAELGGTPGLPAPAFRGDPDQVDAVDSTKRITLESYQRPELGPWGESMRLLNRTPQAKTMVAWYHPEDPNEPWDAVTNPMHPIADVWMGAHWAGQTDGTGIHGHWSVETPMANGDLYSRFGIDFIDHATETRGKDVTHAYFANTDLTPRQGDGAVFRIASGPGSAERRIEFSADQLSGTQGPGNIDPLKRRWWLITDQATEAGSNAGSNFLLRRFADNGDSLGTVWWASRATGAVTFGVATDLDGALGLRWAGGNRHGYNSSPSAAIGSAYAHYNAVATAAADRLIQSIVTGDSSSRLVANINGKFEWGNGGGTRETVLERKSNNVLGIGAGNAFRTGLSATGSRPSASSMGQGSQFFDTTLNKPIWSTGSAWVDAAGAFV